jgi:hypothetical protein
MAKEYKVQISCEVYIAAPENMPTEQIEALVQKQWRLSTLPEPQIVFGEEMIVPSSLIGRKHLIVNDGRFKLLWGEDTDWLVEEDHKVSPVSIEAKP